MLNRVGLRRDVNDRLSSRVATIMLTEAPEFIPAARPRRERKPRSNYRVVTYQMSKVRLNDRDTQKCVILNISDTGARIACDGVETLPERFVLVLPYRGAAVDAEVVWRDVNEVGVRFVPAMAAGDYRAG